MQGDLSYGFTHSDFKPYTSGQFDDHRYGRSGRYKGITDRDQICTSFPVPFSEMPPGTVKRFVPDFL